MVGNKDFFNKLDALSRNSTCDIHIDEYYNTILVVFVSKNGLEEIYVYYTEENPVEKKADIVDAYIYKVKGLNELRDLLYNKIRTIDENQVDEK